jgi:hypothetical protein
MPLSGALDFLARCPLARKIAELMIEARGD